MRGNHSSTSSLCHGKFIGPLSFERRPAPAAFFTAPTPIRPASACKQLPVRKTSTASTTCSADFFQPESDIQARSALTYVQSPPARKPFLGNKDAVGGTVIVKARQAAISGKSARNREFRSSDGCADQKGIVKRS
jgi:hypothetical protein